MLGAFVIYQGFSGDGSPKWARGLFFASIVYLPLLFGIMVVTGRA